MKKLRISLPTLPPSSTSLDLREDVLSRTTVGEVVSLSLGAFDERAREAAGLAGVDEWGWGLRGWDPCSGDEGEEGEEEVVKNWDGESKEGRREGGEGGGRRGRC